MNNKKLLSLLISMFLPFFFFGCASCDNGEKEEFAPSITSEPPVVALAGKEYRYLIDVSGEPFPEVTASSADSDALPAWLSFDSEILALYGVPDENDAGLYYLEIRASNGIEPDAVQEFEIRVIAGGEAPVFISRPLTEAYTGEEYVFIIEVSGEPEPSVHADEEYQLPGWLELDEENLVLAGVPDVDDTGEHDVVLIASNGIEPDAELVFTITVERSNEAPVIISEQEDSEIIEGELYSYQVLATGYPEPVIAAGGGEGADLPGWLSMEEGLLSGIPEAGDAGLHEIVIAAANVAGTDIQTFNITVIRLPAEPVFISEPVTEAVEGENYVYEIIVDAHPAPELQFSGGGGEEMPSWLIFDDESGSLTGIPEASDIGEHSVEITAINDSGSASQSFTITVFPPPSSPLITSQPLTDALAQSEYSYQVIAEGFPLPLFSLNGPDWLLIDEDSGLLSGMPGFEHVGIHAVEIIAENSEGMDTQTFDIEVTAVDTPPSISGEAPETVMIGEEYVFVFSATGWPHPTVSVDNLPEWLFFDEDSYTVSGIPDYEDAGDTGEIVIIAENGIDPSAEKVFSIFVLDIEYFASFDFDDQTNISVLEPEGLTIGSLTNNRGAFSYFSGNPGYAIAANDWHEDDNYFQFEIIPDEGVEFSLYDLTFDDRASNTGPDQWEIMIVDEAGEESSVATGDAHQSFGSTPMNTVEFDAETAGPFNDTLIIRMRGYGASGSSGTWRLDNIELRGRVE